MTAFGSIGDDKFMQLMLATMGHLAIAKELGVPPEHIIQGEHDGPYRPG